MAAAGEGVIHLPYSRINPLPHRQGEKRRESQLPAINKTSKPGRRTMFQPATGVQPALVGATSVAKNPPMGAEETWADLFPAVLKEDVLWCGAALVLCSPALEGWDRVGFYLRPGI